MKTGSALVLSLLLALHGANALASTGAAKAKDDRTVTKVVKMLEGMLEKSKADGDKDREIYAKFLCYCNTKKEQKTTEIAELAESIAQLENNIALLKASNGKLSSEAAKLKMDIFNNEQEQKQLTELRKDENEAYEALKADSEFAISQMNEAIATLAEVGADQTLGQAAADHNQFMAKYSLSQKAQARKLSEALKAASGFLEAQQAKKVESLLQAPFTGTYTAQSGEVVGILKQMRETFTENLEKATAAEEKAQALYDETMEVKKNEHKEMSDLKAEKEATMGENDAELATRESQLQDAEKEKATREAFLAEMIPMCDAKAKEYADRNMMRANEDAGISKAIAILNADSAFETFGTVSATSSGKAASFLQLKAIQAHDPERSARNQVQQLLQQAARKHKSMRLVKIAALLEAGNPFTKVLDAITKLVEIIKAEAKADKENLEWCNTEREESDATIKELDAEILGLEEAIETLVNTIEHPTDGLKAQIEATEIALQDNYNSQVTQTSQRTEQNQAYQADIANLVEAEDLLTAAINVLTKYYDTIGPDAEMEAPKVLAGETEAVPTTFHEEKGYKGQSGAGQEVITMITFILTNTKKEEAFAHQAEHESQHAFEDSMEALKTEEAELQATLANLQELLAEAEKNLAERKKELKAAEEHRASVKAYLLEIKPGCDFITENIGYRDERRSSETDALLEAESLLKGTPVYKAAVAEAELAALGDCRETCVKNGQEHVICKACLAKVEIPGYCAGHPDTEGC